MANLKKHPGFKVPQQKIRQEVRGIKAAAANLARKKTPKRRR